MKTANKMLLGIAQQEIYGIHPAAWRMPYAPKNAFTNIEHQVIAAQMAEKGELDYIFYPDRVFIHDDLNTRPPIFFSIEPLIFMPFASGAGIQAAALYANGIIAMPSTIDQGETTNRNDHRTCRKRGAPC